MNWILAIVAIVVAVDAIMSRLRLRLRTRATAFTARRPARGPEGWYDLNEIRNASEVDQVEVDPSFSRIDNILSGNSRRR